MMDLFILVSGTISIVAVVPLFYLAVRSVVEARELRRIQHELAMLMHDNRAVAHDVHRLQRELLSEQDAAKLRIDETKRTVDHVTAVVEQTAERLTAATADPAQGREDSPRRIRLPAAMHRVGPARAGPGGIAPRPGANE